MRNVLKGGDRGRRRKVKNKLCVSLLSSSFMFTALCKICSTEGETDRLKNQRRMFVLIWAALLFSVKDGSANSGELSVRRFCHGSYCITLRDGAIRAEAGLCVVIPCSFTTSSSFTPQSIDWFKCEPYHLRCRESDMIFSSTDQSGLRGRVTLLEPDIDQRDCSIIINDLTASDSGSYQLRVNGFKYNWSPERFQYSAKATISVKDLTQKPTVMVPPLTEGQQATLSCTAPGLCSGSAPEITWMWRGGGQNESSITGNTETENLSGIEQRHSSTLTFTSSAEHHGANVSCKVGFKNNISTEKTETLNVVYVKDPVIRGERAVKLGDALNLSCSANSFPPSVVTWTKLGSNKTLKEDSKTAELIIPYMTAEDVRKYICTASHQITNRTARTEVTVTMKPRILNSSACELQSEVLTCECVSVRGFLYPPSNGRS